MEDSKRNYLVGVLSGTLKTKINNGTLKGYIACYPGSVALSTAIYPYLDWIKDFVKEDLCLGEQKVMNTSKLVIFLVLAACALIVSFYVLFNCSQKRAKIKKFER